MIASYLTGTRNGHGPGFSNPRGGIDMEKKIKIVAGPITAEAILYKTPTAERVFKALPIEGKANRWGDEIYFSTPLDMPLEPDAREVVEPGELGFWPPGNAFCIFFGPTPASRGEEVRAASPVNVFGGITGDPKAFKRVKDGEKVKVEEA